MDTICTENLCGYVELKINKILSLWISGLYILDHGAMHTIVKWGCSEACLLQIEPLDMFLHHTDWILLDCWLVALRNSEYC